jgi:hypothetical protein
MPGIHTRHPLALISKIFIQSLCNTHSVLLALNPTGITPLHIE